MKTGWKFMILYVKLLVLTSFLSAQIPAGYYYYAEGKTQAALKTALHEIAYPQFVLKYGSGAGHTWEGFYYTDRNENDNSVVDMYSANTRYFNGFKSVDGTHIEHSFPKSWWGGSEFMSYKDLHHLFPADASANMSKSNNPLGIVTGRTTTDNGVSKIGAGDYPDYTGNVFEPADEYKGDFARAYLYIATIYEDLTAFWNSPMLDNNTYPAWKPWAIDLLMEWHQNDPVSLKELVRQELVFDIQGNRNPFIDYPNLVDYIWGDNTSIAYPFPIETNPFLASPRQNENLDFHVIMQGDTQTKEVFVHGVNITSGLNVYLKNSNPSFSVSPQTLSKTIAENGVNIQITFTPLTAGSYIDTLVIAGGGLAQNRLIPIKAVASRTFMALNAEDETPVGATLSWIKDPNATDYELTVYQGSTKAGNLIFSSYMEGSGYNKGVELYNRTGQPINLGDYTIRKQSNGSGEFIVPLNLSGTLANNKTYLIAYYINSNELKPSADLSNDSTMNFNGNDALALYHNGILIDMIGYPDVGSAVEWGKDKTLKRKASVTHPSAIYNEDEWDVYGIDYFSLIGSHTMQLDASETLILDGISTSGKTEYTVDELLPETKYNYYVKAILPGQTKKSVNSSQFSTSALLAPEANAAKDIGDTYFTADWEDDLYTNEYLLNVYTYVGAEDVTITEGFDNIGGNGKPLPDGWIGTASGSYTTPGSSGIAPPSLQLKNNGEYVQTKVFPYPIKNISFMYRFPSNGGTSYFTVEALSDGSWEEIERISYVNTAKTTLNYQFEAAENVKSLKVTFYKNQGNFALDDFVITYGEMQKVNILTDEPVVGSEKVVEDLSPETEYHYTVKSTLGGRISPESDMVKLTTEKTSDITKKHTGIRINRLDEGINLQGLSGGETIRVYDITGVLIHQSEAFQNEYVVPLKRYNIYVLHIQQEGYSYRAKVVI